MYATARIPDGALQRFCYVADFKPQRAICVFTCSFIVNVPDAVEIVFPFSTCFRIA